jgi:hypothetical protein
MHDGFDGHTMSLMCSRSQVVKISTFRCSASIIHSMQLPPAQEIVSTSFVGLFVFSHRVATHAIHAMHCLSLCIGQEFRFEETPGFSALVAHVITISEPAITDRSIEYIYYASKYPLGKCMHLGVPSLVHLPSLKSDVGMK